MTAKPLYTLFNIPQRFNVTPTISIQSGLGQMNVSDSDVLPSPDAMTCSPDALHRSMIYDVKGWLQYGHFPGNLSTFDLLFINNISNSFRFFLYFIIKDYCIFSKEKTTKKGRKGPF